MSIISAIMGAVAASSGGGGGGGGATNGATWYGIYWEPVQEGQQNYFTVDFTGWDGSSTFYWSITDSGGTVLTSQFNTAEGNYIPSAGDSSHDFYFTPIADRTTDGNMGYYVRGGSTYFATNFFNQGSFTVRDSSKTTALVLDLDPANYNPSNVNVWPDSSGNSYTAGIYNYAFDAATAGGVMVFNGATSCEVTSLATGWDNYGSITLSIWFNATAVSGAGNQTLIAKESLFKLRITDAGTINFNSSEDGSNWLSGGTTSGGENLTAGVWNHLAVSVSDNDNIRLYLNGEEVANFSQTILGRNNNPFDIGMWQTTGSPQDYFTGLIGEVMMWNYGLTGDQIRAYYTSNLNRYIPQLPAFDFYNPPTSPAMWPDATTSSVTATIVGTWTYDSGFGGGVVFDGTDDSYIEVQGVNYVVNSFTISIAAKFNINGGHYSPIFDGSSQDRTGQDIWANLWGDLGVGTQGETAHGNPGTVDGATVAWWDFVYSGDSVKAYKNGVEIISGTLPQPNTGWHSNLRIGNEYNQTGNVMAGTFYRIKYVKSALTAVEIRDQYNSFAGIYDLPPIPLSLVFDNTSSYLTVNPAYEVTGSDVVGFTGPLDHLNMVKGNYPQPQAGWIINSTATVDHSVFTATVTTVVDHSTYWALNFEQQNIIHTFGLDGPHTLHPTQPWALGTSWTIEFWIKANDKSTTAQGGIWGLLNQGGWNTVNSINIALSDDKLVVGQGAMNTDVRYTEPTVGVWTHVAIVNNSGSQTVFYNGAKQTKVEGSYDTANYTNNRDPLYIGRLAPIFGGFFNGEMANVRILNRPLYSPPIVQTDVNVGSNANYLGIFETLDYSQDLTGYIVNGPGVYNAKVSSFYSPDYAVSIEGQLFQAGETYTFTSPPFTPPTDLNTTLFYYPYSTGTVLVLDTLDPLEDLSGYENNGLTIASSTFTGGTTLLEFTKSTLNYEMLGYTVREGDAIYDGHNPSNVSTVTGSITDNGSSFSIPVATSWYSSTTDSGTDIVNFSRPNQFVTNTNVIKTIDVPTTSTVALGSLYFDRVSNGYLSLNSPVVFGESDFTVEFWINLKSLVGFNTILSCPTTNVQDGTAIYLNSSLLVIDSSPATGGGDTQWDLSGYISTSTWHHIAISRQGAGIGAWINGKGMGDLSARTNYGTANGYPTIGKLWYGDAHSDMQLTNLRIKVGTAVYDPTHEFITVPTNVLDNNSCNLLLLANSVGNAYDDSTGNYSVTNNNGVVWIAGPVKHY